MSIPVKILIIGTIRKDNSVLLRKKFPGSKPYEETWYSFGCEFVPREDPSEIFIKYVREYLSLNISFSKNLSWDVEIKEDHDGLLKQFIYLDLEFDYVSGDIKIPEELERVEFVEIEKLKEIDIVPPSVKLFKRIGYL